MKKLLFISLFIGLLACKQQSYLSGAYSSGDKYRGVTYYFNPDSTFSVYGWSDNKMDTGKGNYRLAHDSIFLRYQELKFISESTFTCDTIPTDSGFCILRINTFNDHGTLRTSSVNIQMADGFLNTSGNDGTYFLVLKRENFPLSINCFWGQYDPVELRIANPADCNLNIYFKLTDAASISSGTHVDMRFRKLGNRKIRFSYTYKPNKDSHRRVKQTLKKRK